MNVGRWWGRGARRLAVLIAGVVLLLIGAAMLVLPGPGTLVIAAGLAVLAIEFDFAERWRAAALRKLRSRSRAVRPRRRSA